MKEPSIASVREKIQECRKSRKNIRQAFPAQILAEVNQLLKRHKKSKLKKRIADYRRDFKSRSKKSCGVILYSRGSS